MDVDLEERSSRASAPARYSLARLASLRINFASGFSEPSMHSRLSPKSASHRLTLLAELDNLANLANIDSISGLRDDMNDAFRMVGEERKQPCKL
jgi:hypothetical protein